VSEFETKHICPFCNTRISGEIYNGTYGCDSGCDYVTVEVECPECEKVVWSSGRFGSYENEEEEAEDRDEFMQEFAKALEEIVRSKQEGDGE